MSRHPPRTSVFRASTDVPASGQDPNRFPTCSVPPAMTESESRLSVTVWSRPPSAAKGKTRDANPIGKKRYHASG